MNIDSIRSILDSNGQMLIRNLQKDLEVKKTNASSTLSKSLKFVTEVNQTSVIGTLYAEDYWVFVNDGRGASKGGSKPGKLKDKIEEWIKQKSIVVNDISTSSLAFLIARKIHKKGTKGTKVFTNNTTVIANNLQKELPKELSETLKNNILTELKKR